MSDWRYETDGRPRDDLMIKQHPELHERYVETADAYQRQLYAMPLHELEALYKELDEDHVSPDGIRNWQKASFVVGPVMIARYESHVCPPLYAVNTNPHQTCEKCR